MALPLKTPREIDLMSNAGRVLSRLLDQLSIAALPGAATRQIDALARRLLHDAGARAVLDGYTSGPSRPPFPGAICVCIDEEIVHAPPGDRIIRPDSLVTLDLSISVDGWCADAALTVPMPDADAAARALASAARECLRGAAHAMAPGVHWSDIAALIREHAAAAGFTPVGRYLGHGIGRQLHEPPRLPIVEDEVRLAIEQYGDLILRPGMVLTLEPILTEGDARCVELDDGWTAVTQDRSRTAHEERTFAISCSGCTDLTPLEAADLPIVGGRPLT